MNIVFELELIIASSNLENTFIFKFIFVFEETIPNIFFFKFSKEGNNFVFEWFPNPTIQKLLFSIFKYCSLDMMCISKTYKEISFIKQLIYIYMRKTHYSDEYNGPNLIKKMIEGIIAAIEKNNLMFSKK